MRQPWMRSLRKTTTAARAASRAAASASASRTSLNDVAPSSPRTLSSRRLTPAISISRSLTRAAATAVLRSSAASPRRRRAPSACGSRPRARRASSVDFASSCLRIRARPRDRRRAPGDLLHRRADARFGVGDAGLGGLLGFLENLDLRGANGLFALGGGLGEDLLNERSYGLIDRGPNTIFERHVMSRPGAGSLGTQAAAGMRAIVRYCGHYGERPTRSQGTVAAKGLLINDLLVVLSPHARLSRCRSWSFSCPVLPPFSTR